LKRIPIIGLPVAVTDYAGAVEWTLDRALTLPALKWITMEKDNNGFPWVVLGVKGDACYSVQIPAWSEEDPQPATTVLVTIDVDH